MTRINQFTEKGLRVTWTLVTMGFSGSSKFKGQLSGREIVEYAITRVINGDASPQVLMLAGTDARDTEQIGCLLNKLSQGENVDANAELRKWRAIYVANHLPTDKDDYIHGLVALGDIWAYLDFPDDSPHVFQGRNNMITPMEYYTPDNYKRLLDAHKSWLEKEITQLKDVN